MGNVFEMSCKNGSIIRTSGYYWFHFDTFTDKRGRADYAFKYDPSNLVNKLIRKSNNDTNTDVLSSDSLLFITSMSHVIVSTATDFHVPAASLYSMTFFGFLINSNFIFTVHNNFLGTHNLSQRIIFSEVIVNKGGAWNKAKSAFIVPVDGIYFFNFHVTSFNGQKLTVFVKDILSYIVDIRVTEDSLSRSVLLKVKENEEIAVLIGVNTTLRQNNNEMVSFKGFLYSSSTDTPKPAWAVHSLLGMLKEKILPFLFNSVYGKINFGSVHVNVGSLYNGTTREVVISEGGIYYVAYAIHGVSGNTTVSLILNDKTISIIKRPFQFGSEGTQVTRERALLLSLQKNDKLAVKLIDGIIYLSPTFSLCSFIGFMYTA